ncbi:hypothetical protein GNF10_20945 [Nostoc sp. UCD121]|uniref:hypothetical protein n=1 Tax=Nostoc sp. UCD121 TaxID=2681305 RepID=UPI00162A0F0C|nr:hypothetical protein [Nostoc sp. UCD121]MBC1225052.1 hypothetical protein [Nostoc sp. UCD120]MBC1278362.1 hypothetical protein [Nostoc sp. UCD121]
MLYQHSPYGEDKRSLSNIRSAASRFSRLKTFAIAHRKIPLKEADSERECVSKTRYLPPAFLDNFASFFNTVFVVREYALQMTIFPTLLNLTLG